MHRKVDRKTLNKLFSDSWPTDYQGGDQKVGRSATKHDIANSQVKIQFNPQKIATKGFSTDSSRD